MAKSFVDSKLGENKVTVFEKASCPFCRRSKAILKQHAKEDRLEFVNIAVMENQSNIQEYLAELTGERTVPRIFIGLECIGGCSNLVAMEKSGELVRRLMAIGLAL